MLDDGVRFSGASSKSGPSLTSRPPTSQCSFRSKTQIPLECSQETGQEVRERNGRIIQGLNREEPHSIDEDFTYGQPHGFILDGKRR